MYFLCNARRRIDDPNGMVGPRSRTAKQTKQAFRSSVRSHAQKIFVSLQFLRMNILQAIVYNTCNFNHGLHAAQKYSAF